MRTFRLLNKNRTLIFDLSTFYISEVSGLGNAFSTQKENDAVIYYGSTFEDISLTANLGVKSNAYEKYNELMDFILTTGKENIILEYNDGTQTIYTDVYAKSIPRTQKDIYRVMTVTLIFERISMWYVWKEAHLNVGDNVEIESRSPQNINIEVTFSFTGNMSEMKIYNYDFTDLHTIEMINIPNAVVSTKVVIDSENKNVVIYLSEERPPDYITNGYPYINKAKSSFLFVKPNTHAQIYFDTIFDSTFSGLDLRWKEWIY